MASLRSPGFRTFVAPIDVERGTPGLPAKARGAVRRPQSLQALPCTSFGQAHLGFLRFHTRFHRADRSCIDGGESLVVFGLSAIHGTIHLHTSHRFYGSA